MLATRHQLATIMAILCQLTSPASPVAPTHSGFCDRFSRGLFAGKCEVTLTLFRTRRVNTRIDNEENKGLGNTMYHYYLMEMTTNCNKPLSPGNTSRLESTVVARTLDSCTVVVERGGRTGQKSFVDRSSVVILTSFVKYEVLKNSPVFDT